MGSTVALPSRRTSGTTVAAQAAPVVQRDFDDAGIFFRIDGIKADLTSGARLDIEPHNNSLQFGSRCRVTRHHQRIMAGNDVLARRREG